MYCADIEAPLLYFFSVDVPRLLYYSHLTAGVLALAVAYLAFRNNTNNTPARLLLLAMSLFFLWAILDIVLWVNIDSRIIVFVWSFINLVESSVLAVMFYFSYVFLEKREPPHHFKLLGILLLFPFVILMPTEWNIGYFDLANCEAVQGPLVYYFYFCESLLLLSIVGYLLRKCLTVSKNERWQTQLFAIGVILFLTTYSGTNIAGSLTQYWEVLMYGFFGVPVFVGLLAWLMIRYQAFSVKTLSTEALVVAVVVLVASQFFFSQDLVSQLMTILTLSLVLMAGTILISEVKKEVRRKEELQVISDRLAVANEELRRLDNAKSEFISIASHQLRTPLTAIKGFVSLLLEGAYGKLEPGVADTLNKVYVANARLMNLVENLLSISRIEAGRIQYQFAPTQIEDIIGELKDLFAIAAHEKGIELKIEMPKKLLPPADIDSPKIRETISNLIDNAIKYTEQGSVTVRLRATKEQIVVEIIDTGIGIDPDDVPHIFNKFERGKEAARVNVSSTGLGLYVGRRFVEAHRGSIRAESAGPGRGSRFILELPIHQKSGG
jgi:signal transduction histidine kinase